MSTPASLRSTKVVVVSGGTVYTGPPKGTLTAATSGTGLAAADALVRGVAAFQIVYFCTGKAAGYKKLNIATNTVSAWTPSAGALPVGSSDATKACRIIALYRGRIALSGLSEDPHNWFMSASGDPLNWDYSPVNQSPTQAVAGNNSVVGEIGDVITALAPLNDDVMVMGCASSIWVMRGDPMAGGAIDCVTRHIGIVGDEAWAYDPVGNLYFLAEQGLYRLAPESGKPELVSKNRLDKTLADVDISTVHVRLAYDSVWQGVHVFITPAGKPLTASTHYFYDERNDAFWPEQYPIDLGPTAVHRLVADDPANSGVLLGGWDSYIRVFDNAATNDDGTNISSYIKFPPLQPGTTVASARIDDVNVMTAEASEDITAEIYADNSPEAAINATIPRMSKVIGGGRNTPFRQRVAQNAMLLKLSKNSAGTWAFERMSALTTLLNRMHGRRV